MLGGLMLDNERWDDVAERVVADDFYTRPHRHIFTEMARLQESGSPIDLITPRRVAGASGAAGQRGRLRLSGRTVQKHAQRG